MQNTVGSHIQISMHDKTGATSSEVVMISDESLGLVMRDKSIKEEIGADEVDERDAKCIEKHRKRKKAVFHDTCNLPDMLGSQQKK